MRQDNFGFVILCGSETSLFSVHVDYSNASVVTPSFKPGSENKLFLC